MKRILHISKYYYPFIGGTEQTARDCVNALQGVYEQRVICFNNRRNDEHERVDGVEVIRAGVSVTIASQGLSGSYGALLRRTLQDFKPDILIFHYPNPFVAYYLLKFISQREKLILYWHLDITKQKTLKKFFEPQNRKLLKRANLIIATSPNYVQGSPYLSSAKEKCKVIPSCVNEERLKMNRAAMEKAEEIRRANEGKIICFAVGRHTEYKGFQYLIQAAHLLDDRFQIYLAGRGEETGKLKKEAGNDSKIHFLGLVDDTELRGYFAAMDIFCFPSVSKNEAFGLALAEGMYYGKPAVTFHIPNSGVNYVCLNRENGIEVPNRDVEKYAEAIRTLGDDAQLRRRLGEAGRKRVMENLLYAQFQERIAEAVSGVCVYE